MQSVLDLLNQKLVLCLSIYVQSNVSPFDVMKFNVFCCVLFVVYLFVKKIGKVIFCNFLCVP